MSYTLSFSGRAWPAACVAMRAMVISSHNKYPTFYTTSKSDW